MSETADRTIVVTGGSRGIGRAVCLAFASEGAHVVFNYAGNAEAAEKTVADIIARGAKADAIQADVSDEAQVAAFFDAVVEKTGRADVLVNNAGIARDQLLLRMKAADWEAVMNTNLTGVFLCTKAASKIMLKQRYGRIVNLSSVVGVSGNPGQANYAASKAGIVGFTKAVARELASRNITVNAIAPGYIETDMTGSMADKAKEAMLAGIPLGRAGTPEDVAGAAVFLASPAADYITGQVLHVNGGMYM